MLLLIQQEYIVSTHPVDGSVPAEVGNPQSQAQTTFLKFGVFILAGFQKCADIGSLLDQKGLGCVIDFYNSIVFNAKTGADHQIQHPHCIIHLFHDDPPHGAIMCRIWEIFRGRNRRDLPIPYSNEKEEK
jgi:hypothetical protein